MGTNSNIEWTDHTWNPWRGCTKVSPGCDNCYMYRDAKRYGLEPAQVVRAAPATFRAPLALESAADKNYTWRDGDRVFVCSWSDFLHPDADAMRDEAWDIIRRRPGLVFQILTKRPGRLARSLPADWGEGWPNVWLGVTAENQEQADQRLLPLMATPAARRFVSIEPMLGPVDITRIRHGDDPDLPVLPDWVIAGGESGPSARPMHPDWLRSVRDQCKAENIPFFFKQWGEWQPIHGTGIPSVVERKQFHPFVWMSHDGATWNSGCEPDKLMIRVGRSKSGSALDGLEYKEVPK